MKNRKVRNLLWFLVMSLTITCFASGCGSLRKVPEETEPQTQAPQTQAQTEAPVTETEPPTEKETELRTNIAYTSKDRSIRITLPDSTWSVTQDADEMRVFSSGTAAMINIVHAADATAMRGISVFESEQALKDSMTKQYSDANAFEVVDFEKLSSAALDTYEYIVKYNATTSMWAYSITYGLVAKDEAYVITGTVVEENKALLDAVQKSVESFTVLRSGTFSALQGTVVNKNGQSESQSQSGASAEAELQTLTDYGASTTLYASDTVNIRMQPSTEANVLSMLAPGDQVTVVGETAQWFKVNVSGNIGYVNKAFLVYNPTQTETTASTDGTVTDATITSAEMNNYVDYGTSYTYYTTSEVNLRTQPGTDSDVAAVLNGGSAVSVVGETPNWFVVSVNGANYYVSKSYISSTNTGGSSGGTDTGNTGGTGGSTGGNSGTGTISGTVTGVSNNNITVQGDDGNVYTINYSDAAVSTSSGLQNGLYISATVDYSATSPDNVYYATSVTGY